MALTPIKTSKKMLYNFLTWYFKVFNAFSKQYRENYKIIYLPRQDMLPSHTITYIALHATKTQKLVSDHAHNSLSHIFPLLWEIVVCGLVVLAVALK